MNFSINFSRKPPLKNKFCGQFSLLLMKTTIKEGHPKSKFPRFRIKKDKFITLSSELFYYNNY